jgi:hemoglobin-like flavoprotein
MGGVGPTVGTSGAVVGPLAGRFGSRSDDLQPAPVTPEEIGLIRQTSDVLLAVGSPVADAFYERLFDLEPDTRPMFQSNLAAQKSKLTSMLAGLIGAIQHPDVFDSIVTRVGWDHAHLGVKHRHYVSAGVALSAALERCLGSRFTPEVRQAWASLYATLQARMMAAVSHVNVGAAGSVPGSTR